MKEKSYGVVFYLIKKNRIFILLSSTSSTSGLGCVKGKIEDNETIIEASIREFEEEAYITVKEEYLEKFFHQKNKKKDIGVFLYNVKNIPDWENLFQGNRLKRFEKKELKYVGFFELESLSTERIVKNQQKIVKNIIADILQNKPNYILADKYTRTK